MYGLQFLLRGRLGFWTYIYRIIIPEIVYTVFLTIIVYRVFYWINYHLMDTVRKESESIWELKMKKKSSKKIRLKRTTVLVIVFTFSVICLGPAAFQSADHTGRGLHQ